MLGYVDGRAIHVVVADNWNDCETIVITAYVPDPSKWDASFTKRIRP